MAALADMRVIRTLVTRGVSEGMDKVAADLNKVADAHGRAADASVKAATVTETSGRRQLSAAGAWDRLRKSVDETYAAEQRLARAEGLAQRAMAQGRSVEEVNRVLDLYRMKVSSVAGANDNVTKSIGLQRHEWVNLSRQANDALTMLASGSSVMQVVATQSGQVYDALSTSQGGVGGALKEIGSGFLALLTPAKVGLGGIVAAAGLAFVALNKVSSEANEANRALRVGAGTRSGLAASEIGGLASGAPGLSRGAGRSALLSYASSGADRNNAVAALGMTKLLADVSYEGDVGEAQKSLSDAMRGGTDSLLRYVDNIRPLSAATTQWIESLQSSRGEQAANAELLRLLNEGLSGVGIEVPLWRQALTKLGNAAGDLADAFLKEAARRANAEVEEARRIGAAVSRGLSTSSADARGGRPVAVLGGARGPMTQRSGRIDIDLPPAGLDAIEGSLAELGAARARGAVGSRQVESLTAKYDAEREALRKLRSDLEVYDRQLKDSNVTAQLSAEQLEAARKARADLAGAVESYLSSEEKRRRADELALRSINARTDAERAAIAVEQKRLDLAGERMDKAERERQIEAARTQELARSTRAADDRLRASNDNLGLAGLLPYQRAQQEIEQRFRRQNEENAGNPEALRRNAAVRANEMRALDAEHLQAPLRSTTMSINEQIAALKVQKDSLFASDEAAAAMAAKQDLVNAAIRAGIDPAKAYGGELDALAAKMGQVKAANDDYQRTRQNIVGGMDEARSGISGTLSGVISDLRNKKDPTAGIVNSLTRWSDQFVERTLLKPLTEGLLGRFGQPGGGLFGDLLGKSGVFGSLTAAPTAIQTPIVTITAASVTMGGLGGMGMGSLGLGSTPGTGSPLTGAGSGTLGFGLGGAQSVGSQAVGSGLGSFGFGANGLRTVSSAGGGDAESIFRGLVARGFSPVQAAAAVGNIKLESGFSTSIEGDKGLPGGSSFGLMQWREGRLANLKALADSQGKDWRDRDVQLDFISQEARGGDSGFANWFRRTAGETDVRGAAASFARDVERPSASALSKSLGARTGAASDAYDRFGVGRQSSLEDTSRSFAVASDQASDSMSTLSDAASAIPAGTDAATSSLSGLANSLLNFKPGEGGGINVAGLFGGGSSSGMSMTDVATWSANGNIMTSRGPVRLNMYESGGIANSPQVSVFGEGRLPEAYVPLPDGRSIPVTMKGAGQTTASKPTNPSGPITLAPTYNIPPLANGVTPQDVVRAIEDYDRRLDRRLSTRADMANRRFG